MDASAAGPAPAGRLSSLQARLSLLVLACVLPGAALAAYLVADGYELHRTRTYEAASLLARQVALEIDRELGSIEAGLQVMATDADLRAGRLEAFHRRASDAVGSQIVYNYIVTEPGGRMVLNTLVPWGQPLPTQGTPPALERVFTTGRPVLTDLFLGPVTHQPALALGVPVLRGREVVYSLNVGLAPAKVNEILGRHVLADQWLMAVVDGSGVILARTRDLDKFMGQKAVPDLVAALARQREGRLETKTKEGYPTVAAWARSGDWSWSVVVGAPKQVIEAELYRLLLWMTAGILAAFGLGLGLAGGLARQVTRSIRSLNDAALALCQGRPVTWPRDQWKEAEAVGRAIVQAGQILDREHHRATHDGLTNLPNRVLFEEVATRQLARTQRDRGHLAVLALDLDGFKGVNDSWGHATGDLILKTVADRIRGSLRASDPAARIGGDEFAVLLEGSDRATALLVAGRLVSALAQPYPVVGSQVSASIGVALFPSGGQSLADLTASADRALYRAKAAGKRCVAVEP